MYESIYVQCDGEYEIIRICNAFFILCTQLNASSAFHSPAFQNQQILQLTQFGSSLICSTRVILVWLDLIWLDSNRFAGSNDLYAIQPLSLPPQFWAPPLKSIFSMFQMIFCTKHVFDLVNFSFFFFLNLEKLSRRVTKRPETAPQG